MTRVSCAQGPYSLFVPCSRSDAEDTDNSYKSKAVRQRIRFFGGLCLDWLTKVRNFLFIRQVMATIPSTDPLFTQKRAILLENGLATKQSFRLQRGKPLPPVLSYMRLAYETDPKALSKVVSTYTQNVNQEWDTIISSCKHHLVRTVFSPSYNLYLMLLKRTICAVQDTILTIELFNLHFEWVFSMWCIL